MHTVSYELLNGTNKEQKEISRPIFHTMYIVFIYIEGKKPLTSRE